MATGWDEGVRQMSLGEKAILTMSGYGSVFTSASAFGFCDVDVG
jgi:FKBP-type peptidyl-prolyl cis-trans isomerase